MELSIVTSVLRPMISTKHRTKLTGISLLLVWWVIAICLVNNISYILNCAEQFQDSSVVSVQKYEDASDDVSKCDLSEHLVNLEQHHLVDMPAIVSFIAVALILWLLSSTNYFPPFTEPILRQGRRVHLAICVFRE